MIPESWLEQRLETADLCELTKRELMNSGLSDADVQRLLGEVPSDRWAEKWHQFIGQMVVGDELWSFKSPPETWRNLAGRAGSALVRSGRIVDSIVIHLN